jgi:hypothetical protein
MIKIISRLSDRARTSNNGVVIAAAAIGLGLAVVGGVVYYMLRGAGRLAIGVADRKMLKSK